MTKGKQTGSTTRDLTDFFLEWRDTCAIDKCKRKEDVAYVHALFDRKFKEMAALPRLSKLGLSSISEFTPDFERTHAFHLVELEFYTPGQKGETSKRFGEPLKNYLFESSAAKRNPGGINGYFLLMLKDVIKNSFRKSAVAWTDPWESDETGSEVGILLKVGTSPSNPEHIDGNNPAEFFDLNECVDEFNLRFGAMWSNLGKPERLALLCDVFFISKNIPEIVAASGLKKAAFYNRRPLVILRGVIDEMLTHYEVDMLMCVCRISLRANAYALGKKDPDCSPVIALVEQRGLVSKVTD